MKRYAISTVIFAGFFATPLLAAENIDVKIIITASTNTREVDITFDGQCNAVINEQPVTLDQPLCANLLQALQNAGPLQNFPVPQCTKSVSFGTSFFIEKDGVRSPDISCSKDNALLKAADPIVKAAEQATNFDVRKHRL